MSERMATLFRTLTSGVYVIGAAHKGKTSAFTAAWVMQLSFKPPMLGFSVNPDNFSYSLIKAGKVFSVNVLEQGSMDMARLLGTHSTRDMDKLEAIRWRPRTTGAPVLEDALAYFDCRLRFTRRTGDHVLITGEVIDGTILKPRATPMTYAQTGDLDGASDLYPARFRAG
ncbi:MAG: flavin reductase [Gammaproteobacteria bacterium]|nr:flavin reductase [Gammaproteobacteria bacterium]